MSLHVLPTADDLAAAAAARIADAINTTDRTFSLGLAGGGTPAATYRRLAKAEVQWSRVVMWLGDERWVPHDHEESNTRMARSTLVDHVLSAFLAPDTAFGDPEEAAAHYGDALREAFHDGRPDLVLLGMGDDGHTASLFPGTDALAAEGAYLATWVEQKGLWRLTASLPLLASAREIIFLVQGESKAGVLAEIIDDGRPYPAQQVAAGAANVHWMVDEAAASRLRSVPR
ncbi:MAG: 6-phosphogluconolactonase [Acidimicrobiia bacterium]|nr:6-phosphogluconolactonase [Acidimicrobiia bacterium]